HLMEPNPAKHKGAPDDKLSCGAPSNVHGNPINASIGNKFQEEIDYYATGLFPIRFIRRYNSMDGVWRHNYSTHLRFGVNSVTLVWADGRESYFSILNSIITADATEIGKFAATESGWKYLSTRNETFEFDAEGRLTRWLHPNGLTQSLRYEKGSI